MREFYKDLLTLSKDCCIDYVTTSRMVSPKGCWLFGAVVVPDDAGNAVRVYLRNGENVNSDIALTLKYRYGNYTIPAVVPVYFNKGLYVELNDNADAVTVQYLEDFGQDLL